MPIRNGPPSNEIKPTVQRPRRQRFSTADKVRILKAADDCASGMLGALMRREGIYSSQLYAWRKQRDRGELDAGAARKRAQAKSEAQSAAKRIAELERENRKMQRKLARAELLLDIQKKIAGLLGIDLASPETNENAE